MVARKVRDSLPLLLNAEWEAKSTADQTSASENGDTNGNSQLDEFMDDDLCESTEAENNEKFPELYLPLKQSILKAFKSMDKELKLHPTIDCFCSGSTAVTLVVQVIVKAYYFNICLFKKKKRTFTYYLETEVNKGTGVETILFYFCGVYRRDKQI